MRDDLKKNDPALFILFKQDVLKKENRPKRLIVYVRSLRSSYINLAIFSVVILCTIIYNSANLVNFSLKEFRTSIFCPDILGQLQFFDLTLHISDLQLQTSDQDIQIFDLLLQAFIIRITNALGATVHQFRTQLVRGGKTEDVNVQMLTPGTISKCKQTASNGQVNSSGSSESFYSF